MNLTKNINQYLSLIPIIGIGLFFILTLIAIVLYSGGSTMDTMATGFSMIHNYWCDLLKDIAKNGQVNPAKPYAMAATMVFSFSGMFFWYYLPQLLEVNRVVETIIQWSGTIAMFITMFLFTDWHDIIITLGGLLMGIALILVFISLYQSKLYKLWAVGMFCMLVSVFNYTIYYLDTLEIVLPLTQKIGMLLYVSWVLLSSIDTRKKIIKN